MRALQLFIRQSILFYPWIGGEANISLCVEYLLFCIFCRNNKFAEFGYVFLMTVKCLVEKLRFDLGNKLQLIIAIENLILFVAW